MYGSPSKNNVEAFKRIGKDYFRKLLLRNDQFSLIPSEYSLRNYVEQSYRTKKAHSIIDHINRINTASDLKFGSPMFNESLELALDIMKECDSENTLKSNISEAVKLFEIEYPLIKKLVSDPKGLRSGKLFRAFLTEYNVNYNESMFDTWEHMILLRNYYEHKKEVWKLRAVLKYFNEPLREPDPQILWQKILNEFETSLIELRQIMVRISSLKLPEEMQLMLINNTAAHDYFMIEQLLDKMNKIEKGLDKQNKLDKDN